MSPREVSGHETDPGTARWKVHFVEPRGRTGGSPMEDAIKDQLYVVRYFSRLVDLRNHDEDRTWWHGYAEGCRRDENRLRPAAVRG
jgi:hypothetical protein